MTWKKNLNILRTPDPLNLKKQLVWVESLGQAHPNPIYSPPDAKEGFLVMFSAAKARASNKVGNFYSDQKKKSGKLLPKRKVAHSPAYVFWFVCLNNFACCRRPYCGFLSLMLFLYSVLGLCVLCCCCRDLETEERQDCV